MIRRMDWAPRALGRSGAVRWLLLLCALAVPAVAEVRWVAPSDPIASSAIVAGRAGAVLCRGSVAGQTYTGYTQQSTCIVAAGTPAAGFTVAALPNYEVAIGLTHWLRDVPPGVPSVVGGQAGVAAIRPCRVDDAIGYVRSDETVCRVAKAPDVTPFASYELLFPIDLSDGVYVHNSSGMCVTPDGTIPGVAPKACDWAKAPLQLFRLRNITTGIYELGTPGGALNPVQCMASGASGTVTLGMCGSAAARLRIFDASGNGHFKIGFETTGSYLDGLGLNTLLAAYLQRPLNNTADQRFTILSAADAARRIRVISYNIMLLNNNIFAGLRQYDRAKWIAQQIQLEQPGTDVVAIQEAFDEGNIGLLFQNSGFDALVKEMEKYGFLFRTQRPFAAQPENGGVVIFSRWPIEVRDNNVFDPFVCEGADCFAAKGINYAKINKLGRRYHFFNTHLQAGGNNWDFRRRQLEEFRPWMNGLIGSRTDEPVILTGDFNVDMEHQPADYREMLRLLGAEFVNPPRPVGVPPGPVAYRYTADPAVNEITRERGGSAEWLDYILCATPGPMPAATYYEVKNYKRSQEFRIDIIGKIFDTNDLSDHAALFGILVFPYGSRTTPVVSTVPVRFQAENRGGVGGVPPAVIRVNGELVPLPATLQLETTLTHRIETVEIPASGGQRWRPAGWSHTSEQNWDLVNPSGDITYKAYFNQEYELVVQANPPSAGTTSGSGWYAFDAAVIYSATPADSYRFLNFSGDVEDAPTRNPGRIRMRGPRTIIANFESTTVNTRFEARNTSGGPAPQGAMVLVDGVAYQLPVNLPLNPARTYRIEAAAPAPGAGARWVFQRWLHTPGPAWDLVQPAAEATYAVEFQQQFLLQTDVAPLAGGQVSGGGWYAAGTVASLDATAQPGYAFTGYSGDVTSASPSVTVSMTQARRVLASFRASGLPVLALLPGARSGTADTRILPLTLRNAGQYAALNARITGITAHVLEGDGAVTLQDVLPLSYGAIPPGSSATRQVNFTWPDRARRVRFVVNFEADGGYTGTAAVNLFRN